jgi:dTDP-glucose 4,6-dehydratase
MIKNRKIKNMLVTGGCGFIGSNFIRHVFQNTDFRGKIINLDNLTYAGNPDNLSDIVEQHEGKRYIFKKADVGDFNTLEEIFKTYHIDTVVHFAAESIFGPADFVNTNIMGTFNLLETARRFWGRKTNFLFHHISTDEVFGSLGKTGTFSENTPYDPRSPYSASKASSDHLVRAYHHTYAIPVTLSNCSNNYGPFQFPEKLIPLMIINAWKGKPLPVYGDGQHSRDWLYVGDHCAAVWLIITRGKPGETYTIGGNCEQTNIRVVEKICDVMDKFYPVDKNLHLKLLKLKISSYRELITHVPDRPGHDRRYAINAGKIRRNLGWKPGMSFDSGLKETVQWYLRHEDWIQGIVSGEYRNWIKRNYNLRRPVQS